MAIVQGLPCCMFWCVTESHTPAPLPGPLGKCSCSTTPWGRGRLCVRKCCRSPEGHTRRSRSRSEVGGVLLPLEQQNTGSESSSVCECVALCGQELAIPVAIPLVRVEVPHLLEIGTVPLNTFYTVFHERSWWTHLPPYRDALPHAVACNIFKFVGVIDWIRTCQIGKAFSTFDTSLRKWSIRNAKSAEHNAETGSPIFPCVCAECWQEHYCPRHLRRTHVGWHPLRCFWIDYEYESGDEEAEDDSYEDDEMGLDSNGLDPRDEEAEDDSDEDDEMGSDETSGASSAQIADPILAHFAARARACELASASTLRFGPSQPTWLAAPSL